MTACGLPFGTLNRLYQIVIFSIAYSLVVFKMGLEQLTTNNDYRYYCLLPRNQTRYALIIISYSCF